ncbi:MAG: hypothetical protein IIV87_04110 [Oscillospiraceae bacterium]|nr:hypothetical protein [Oscillospiraceae bacterium]
MVGNTNNITNDTAKNNGGFSSFRVLFVCEGFERQFSCEFEQRIGEHLLKRQVDARRNAAVETFGTVVKLDGVISDESRLALLPLDLDTQAELEAVEEKKQQNYALFSANFNEVDDEREGEAE